MVIELKKQILSEQHYVERILESRFWIDSLGTFAHRTITFCLKKKAWLAKNRDSHRFNTLLNPLLRKQLFVCSSLHLKLEEEMKLIFCTFINFDQVNNTVFCFILSLFVFIFIIYCWLHSKSAFLKIQLNYFRYLFQLAEILIKLLFSLKMFIVISFSCGLFLLSAKRKKCRTAHTIKTFFSFFMYIFLFVLNLFRISSELHSSPFTSLELTLRLRKTKWKKRVDPLWNMSTEKWFSQL